MSGNNSAGPTYLLSASAGSKVEAQDLSPILILGQKESSTVSPSDLPSQQFSPYTSRITCSSRDY